MSELKRFKVQVFGASTIPLATQREWAKEHRFAFPLLADPEKKVATAYGVWDPVLGCVERWAFVIDDKGIIRAIERFVDPMRHGKDLVKMLADLGIPRR